MTTKVKSLFKGLRYISQIFDDKEDEIEIGFPTDVKHVAHIGWDGPSANMPSWMNEFRSPSEVRSGPLEQLAPLSPKSKGVPAPDSPTRLDIPKGRRHHSSNLGSPINSPTRRGGSDGAKGSSRRRHSKKEAAVGSPARDPSGSSRHTRRHQKSNLGPQAEPANPDQPAIPKSTRRKKGTTTEGGSTKSTRSSRISRSTGHDSLTEIQFAEIVSVAESQSEAKNKEEVTNDK